MFGKQLVSLLTILLITAFNCYNCLKDIQKECPDLPFVKRTEWGARVSKESLTPMKLPVPHVFIHHTSSYSGQCLDLNSCIRAVRRIQDYQMDYQDQLDISYNVLIGGDGRIYWGRPTLAIGSQPLGLYDRSITIGFIGQYEHDQEPSQPMLATAQRFLKCLEKVGDRLTGDYQLHGHRDQSCETQSPGKNVYNVIKQWPHFKGGPLPTYWCQQHKPAPIGDLTGPIVSGNLARLLSEHNKTDLSATGAATGNTADPGILGNSRLTSGPFAGLRPVIYSDLRGSFYGNDLGGQPGGSHLGGQPGGSHLGGQPVGNGQLASPIFAADMASYNRWLAAEHAIRSKANATGAEADNPIR